MSGATSGPGSGAGPSPGSRLGPAVLIFLLIGALVAGILVYRARTPDLALEVVSFDRTLDAERRIAEIVFFVRFSEPEARVEIVGRDQVLARTLAPSLSLDEGERIRCAWDGLDDEGERVDPGRFRLRVTLPGEDREMVFPRRLDVEAAPENAVTNSVGEPCEAA